MPDSPRFSHHSTRPASSDAADSGTTEPVPAQDQPIPFRESDLHPQMEAPDVERVARLHREMRELRRQFAAHPLVHVAPTEGFPPHKFQVDFAFATLLTDEHAQPTPADGCSFELSLPSSFPAHAPVITPLESVFHPNISDDRVEVLKPWKPSGTVSQLIWTLAQMCAGQIWDAARALNPNAARWFDANLDSLPTYSGVLTPPPGLELAADPTGATVLDDIRDSLEVFVDRLLQPGHVVDSYEVVTVSQSIRERLRPFLEQSDPDETVREMDELAHLLPHSRETLAMVRRLRTQTARSSRLLHEMLQQERLLTQLVRWLDRHARALPGVDAIAEVRALPDALDNVFQELSGAVTQTEAFAGALRSLLDELARPPVIQTSSRLLNERIATELGSLTSSWSMRLRRMRDALMRVSGEVDVVRAELPTIKRLVDCRRMLEEIDAIDALIGDLTRSAERIQTYSMRTDAGTFGPFGFEMPVEYGNWRFALRRISPEQIDIVIADTCEVLASFPPSQVFTLELASEESLVSEFVEFTVHADALSLQVEIGDRVDAVATLLSQITTPLNPTGRFEAFTAQLIRSDNIHAMKELRNLRHGRWALALDELALLSEIRTRQAERQLLLRAIDALSQRSHARSQVGILMRDVDAKLARIVSRSSTSEAGGEVVLHARDAREYQALLMRRAELESQYHETDALFAAWSSVLQPLLEHRHYGPIAGEFVVLKCDVPANELAAIEDVELESLIGEVRTLLPAVDPPSQQE